MSQYSNSSNATSISFRGEEVDVSEALDVLFRDIQEQLNHCHCAVRQLAQCEERADTFMEAAEYDFEIQDFVTSLVDLFKELKTVSKDVLGKVPAEYKDEYKMNVEKRKKLKEDMKAQEKLLKAIKE